MLETAAAAAGRVCYMEVTVPALCIPCRVLTFPATGSVPGSSCGPDMRRKIMNIHEVAPPVRRIRRLLHSNHGAQMGLGTASNCLAAMAGHAREGRLWARAPGWEGEVEVLEAHSGPSAPPGPEPGPEPRESSAGLRNGPGLPPLLHQISEAVSMAPYVSVDESREKVAGGHAQALVLQSPAAALVAITPDKSKGTMRRVFGMALRRPLVADMYLAGNAFEGGVVQTCNAHVWRKSESLAVAHGIGSPEQAYSAALLRAYRNARDDAARITEMAGGPAVSACDAGRALRGVPGLAGYAEASRAWPGTRRRPGPGWPATSAG